MSRAGARHFIGGTHRPRHLAKHEAARELLKVHNEQQALLQQGALMLKKFELSGESDRAFWKRWKQQLQEVDRRAERIYK